MGGAEGVIEGQVGGQGDRGRIGGWDRWGDRGQVG